MGEDGDGSSGGEGGGGVVTPAMAGGGGSRVGVWAEVVHVQQKVMAVVSPHNHYTSLHSILKSYKSLHSTCIHQPILKHDIHSYKFLPISKHVHPAFAYPGPSSRSQHPRLIQTTLASCPYPAWNTYFPDEGTHDQCLL